MKRWIRSPLIVATWMGSASIVLAQIATTSPAWQPPEAQYETPLFGGGEYDPAVPTPASILGFQLGDRPVTHGEIERCLHAWKDHPRLRLVEHGQTHERRRLYHVVITADRNHARMNAIRQAIGKLADPRRMQSGDDPAAIIRDTPAVAWMAYCIHGDELSGADAAVGLIHHLIAARDADTGRLLDELVICVDPLMNPDGRDRFVQQVDQAAGATPNFDLDAVQHGGRWPFGRTNHYYFDMNRDWILGVCPETRGRRAAIAAWQPQLLVDGHEMGGQDTFLFYPPREPFNPEVPASLHKWWKVFADEQGAAFDRFGWSYYTREWADFWYPGYSDGYGAFNGAVAILYEQAGIGGRPVRQRSGRILTYREAVHHQAVSSIANLRTLAANRAAVLADFHEFKRAALQSRDSRGGDVFVLPPGGNESRKQALLANLLNQGIEIGVAQDAFAGRDVRSSLAQQESSRRFPAGSYVIRRGQPLAALVGVNLDFDPRMDDAFLASERRELETRGESRLYDITGWSLSMAYGLDAYWCGSADVQTEPLRLVSPRGGSVALPGDEPHAPYGYVVDAADDAALRAAAELLQADVVVRIAQEAFTAGGRRYSRGSLLIRTHENGPELRERLQRAAAAAGVEIAAVYSARSPDAGPDLGGQRFTRLQRPRVVLLGGAGVDVYSYGTIWHLLDHEIGLELSQYDMHQRGDLDLRRFNVVILPECWGDAAEFYKPLLDDLKTWMEQGGTVIAVGDATAAFTGKDSALSAVRTRGDVLSELAVYAEAVAAERTAGRTPIDAAAIWETPRESPPASAPAADEEPGDEATLARREDYRRRFAPQGAIVRAELNLDHWLTAGCASAESASPGNVPAGGGATTGGATTADAGATIADGAALAGGATTGGGATASGGAATAGGGTTAGGAAGASRPELPVFVSGSRVLMARPPTATAVRLASAERLRLSGLLWPEATVRLADSAYLTAESVGHGQLILFAHSPNFRGTWHGTRRLLANAVLLGPGCGASTPAP